jgi:hypothetical protein
MQQGKIGPDWQLLDKRPDLCCPHDVRFSNRPVRVKRFQTIHVRGIGVTRGLVLLSGIGT